MKERARMTKSYEQVEEAVDRLRLKVDVACAHLEDMIADKAFVQDRYGDYARQSVRKALDTLSAILKETAGVVQR